MTIPQRTIRALLAAALALLVVAVPGLVGGATAQTTPVPTTTTTGTTPLTIQIDPYGSTSYKRLAKVRTVPLGAKVSAPATVHFEVQVPRSVARALKLKVAKGSTYGVLAEADVTATAPGYIAGWARFSGAVAKRLAAKPRKFKMTLVATSGEARATAQIGVNKRD